VGDGVIGIDLFVFRERLTFGVLDRMQEGLQIAGTAVNAICRPSRKVERGEIRLALSHHPQGPKEQLWRHVIRSM